MSVELCFENPEVSLSIPKGWQDYRIEDGAHPNPEGVL
jgi:hypothetical protein